jgi:acetolactate synthase-1/2/3 large subunit
MGKFDFSMVVAWDLWGKAYRMELVHVKLGQTRMNVHEIATLKAINTTNVVLFILNNNGYASIRNSQQRHFGSHSGTSFDDGLLFPEWALIAESLGIDFISLENPAKFDFKSLIGVKQLQIVEIKLEANEKRGPSLKTIMTDLGPKTQPLEEISWD